MKKIIGLFLICAMLLSMVACSSGVSQEEYDKVVSERDTAIEERDSAIKERDELKAEILKNEDDSENSKENEKENETVDTLDDLNPTEPFFEYTGNGDDVVTGLTTETISVLKTTHDGDGHFSVKAHYEDTYDLLVNTTDPYIGGCTLLFPEREYTLEVSAKGEWNVQAFVIGTTSAFSFSGSGDFVTPMFVSSSDVYEITAEGDGHFSVRGYYEDGSYDLLVNTTESYSGKVMFKNKGKLSFFEITGERDFVITPAQ